MRLPFLGGEDSAASLETIGPATVRALVAGRSIGSLLLSRRQLLACAADADPTELRLPEAVAMAVAHLHALGDWSHQTARRMGREIGRMAVLLEHHGVTTVGEVTTSDIEVFARGATNRGGTWREPSASTMHIRLSSARLFYRCLRSLHVVLVDPTLEVRLPPRTALSTRPLTDDEELVCRLTSEHTLTETRRPVAWALGQATATTAEQAAVRVRDVDLSNRRVWLGSSAKRSARWGQLTPWGVGVIGRAIDRCTDPNAGLVYPAQNSAESGTASVCRAVSQILGDAGYGHEPDVRPGSLVSWAGVKIFEDTGRIEVVAAGLGLASLDSAALAIGWDWRQ